MYYSVGSVIDCDQGGDVYKGKWNYRNCTMDVAVKILKPGSNGSQIIMFFQEAIILNQLKHPNVITLYGVVRRGRVSV